MYGPIRGRRRGSHLQAPAIPRRGADCTRRLADPAHPRRSPRGSLARRHPHGNGPAPFDRHRANAAGRVVSPPAARGHRADRPRKRHARGRANPTRAPPGSRFCARDTVCRFVRSARQPHSLGGAQRAPSATCRGDGVPPRRGGAHPGLPGPHPPRPAAHQSATGSPCVRPRRHRDCPRLRRAAGGVGPWTRERRLATERDRIPLGSTLRGTSDRAQRVHRPARDERSAPRRGRGAIIGLVR
jgi:hypothetical protein